MSRKVVKLADRRDAQRELERRLRDLKARGARPLPAENLDELDALLRSGLGRRRRRAVPLEANVAKAKSRTESMGVVSFRFDAETLKRLDAAVARMNELEPWRASSRTDLVRLAVARFLEADEKGKAR